MKKNFVFLSMLLFTQFAHSECVSVSSVTKCAKFPERISMMNMSPAEYTSNSWSFILLNSINGEEMHYCSGNQVEKYRGYIYCYMTYPFKMTIKAYVDNIENLRNTDPYQVCSGLFAISYEREYLDVSALPGDKCPDGFYTVPYEISCGQGFVDTTDIPSCDEDTTGDFCIIQSMVPCASGINLLRTSVGIDIPLWSKKHTEPAMCVLYNGVTCYGNLSVGRESNAINVQIDDQIYHLVK